MTVDVRPASVFEDVRTLVGPKSAGATSVLAGHRRVLMRLALR